MVPRELFPLEGLAGMNEKSMPKHTVRYRSDHSKPKPRISDMVQNASEDEVMRRAAGDHDMPEILASRFLG